MFKYVKEQDANSFRPFIEFPDKFSSFQEDVLKLKLKMSELIALSFSPYKTSKVLSVLKYRLDMPSPGGMNRLWFLFISCWLGRMYKEKMCVLEFFHWILRIWLVGLEFRRIFHLYSLFCMEEFLMKESSRLWCLMPDVLRQK